MMRRFLTTIVFIVTFAQCALGYELTILHSNDIHGRVNPVEYKEKSALGGWARRAGTIKDIKSNIKNTLVLDAGDIAQGTVFYQLFDGMPEVKFVDMIGYDAFTVGNHELDKGVANFENLCKFSKTPILSANLEFKNNFYLNGKIKTHIIKQYDGFKVGVVGMITPSLKSISAAAEDVELRDYDKTLKFLVDYLKDEVDLVVLLSHSGFKRDLKTAKNIDGIDIIVGGHSHTLLKKPYVVPHGEHKTLILQAGEFGMFLGKLDVNFDEKGVECYEYCMIPLDENSKQDKKITAEIKKLNSDVKKIKNSSIGKTKINIDARKDSLRTGLTNAGVLVGKSLKKLVPEADAVILNAGSIRAHKIISKGSLTQMEIMEMLPFPNKIVILDLKGCDIKSVLESSARRLPEANRSFLQTLGLSYSVNLRGESQVLSDDLTKLIKRGNRIKNVKINGKNLEDDKVYKIVTTDFLFSGGDGYFQFKNASKFSRTNYPVTKAVIEYIQSKRKVKPKVTDKITIEE